MTISTSDYLQTVLQKRVVMPILPQTPMQNTVSTLATIPLSYWGNADVTNGVISGATLASSTYYFTRYNLPITGGQVNYMSKLVINSNIEIYLEIHDRLYDKAFTNNIQNGAINLDLTTTTTSNFQQRLGNDVKNIRMWIEAQGSNSNTQSTAQVNYTDTGGNSKTATGGSGSAALGLGNLLPIFQNVDTVPIKSINTVTCSNMDKTLNFVLSSLKTELIVPAGTTVFDWNQLGLPIFPDYSAPFFLAYNNTSTIGTAPKFSGSFWITSE